MFVSWFLVLICGFVLYRLCFRKHRNLNLPPGPKPWPIVGNISDLPPAGTPEYQHWLKHKEAYGPISSVSLFGQLMVILHDREAAHELMEKRSMKTSGRPWLEFAYNMCGFGRFVLLKPYDDVLRKYRKFIHQQFGTKTLVSQFQHIQLAEVAHLLVRVLETPQDAIQHFKTEAGATILEIVYGYSVEPRKVDPLVEMIEHMMQNFSAAIVPLYWPGDFLSIIKYLPEWFPGCGSNKTARIWKSINEAVTDIPYNFVEQQMADGINKPSYVSAHIQDVMKDEHELSIDDQAAIKATAANLYAAGSDTTASSLNSLLLAMLKFPSVQKKAQEEIDGLTGSLRLPRFEDRKNLPYVDAMVKEALRWFPVTPMGAVHAVEEDLTIKGYVIPKGTILLPAVRWFLHDPQVYKHPEVFDPSRFLPPRNEPDPAEAAFGFGRRICAGRYLADSSLFITIAQFLATFHVSKALDDKGREIEPQIESVAGVVDHPVEYPFRIAPRSPLHAAMVENLRMEYPNEKGDSEMLALHKLPPLN